MRLSRSMNATSVNRRQFLAATGAFGLTIPLRVSSWAKAAGPLRFGVIADVHHDIMHDGIDRISAFIDAMQKSDVEFIVQLGDFCRPYDYNRPFMDAWNRYEGPKYHVLGNHDTDGGFTQAQTMKYWDMSARYYTFDAGGIRFMVLDGNEPGGKKGGYKRFIATEQAEWIKAELEKSERPVVVMIHQPLDHELHGVENHSEMRAILEESRKGDQPGVIACLSGHLHEDYTRVIHDIVYAQINSASYFWLEDESWSREVYSADIHKKRPWIRRVAPYRDPLWAVVTMDLAAGQMVIEGRHSEFVGPDPWERGAQEPRYSRETVRAEIRGWKGPIA